MKLSITVASIITLVAAAPVEVRDPQPFGNGADFNQGGFVNGGPQNGAELPQGFNPADSPGLHGDDPERVGVDQLTSGLVQPTSSTGPKNANGLTAQKMP